MSTQQTDNGPSVDVIREARHTGFVDAIGYMPEDRQRRLAETYSRQDSARERNVGEFVSRIVGDGGQR
jgi:hypothetical protein